MICPKCGFEQPESPECARCGIIVSRYRGPALGASALRPSASPPPSNLDTVRVNLPLSSSESAGGTVYGEPQTAAAMAGGAGTTGTIYGGTAPVAAGGGTVYGGPPPGASVVPAFSAFRGGSIGVGAILGEAFAVYFANFFPFLLLTVIVMSPVLLAEGYIASMKAGNAPALVLLPSTVLLISLLLCPYLATAAITYGVFQQIRGKDATIGECLRWGLALMLPILGLAIVQGFLIGMALIACLIPGIYLATRWAVSIPAAVTERCGVFEAMNRSTLLTEGWRMEVFGVLFVLGILNLGGTFAIRKLTAGEPSLTLLVQSVKDVFTVGISATASAVLYYRLRDAKETIDVDQIASVFS